MLSHLESYNDDSNKIEKPDIAFSSDGMDKLNENIQFLNGGKPHKPIFKVRTYEPRGNKFNVGNSGNKLKKFVEAAKGTNLFFAIYQDDKGKRNFATIPLNIVIERQKQGLNSVPDENEFGNKLLMYLSPNDLVYTLDDGENLKNIDWKNSKNISGKIYKMVSCTQNRVFFLPHSLSKVIVDKFEFESLNKVEKALDTRMIKQTCFKIKIDRLGNLSLVV
jgi:CRISPR-associated endonuclease Csn1